MKTFVSFSVILVTTLLLLGTSLAFAQGGPQEGPPHSFTYISDLVYTSDQGRQPLKLDIYQAGQTVNNQPVIIWVPQFGVGEQKANQLDQVQELNTAGSKFPTPIAGYLGYHYTVVSLEYTMNSNRKEKNIQEAIAYLEKHADAYHLDVSNIGMVEATASGYKAEILRQSSKTAETQKELTVAAKSDKSFSALQSPQNTEAIVRFFDKGLGGGPYDAQFDPMHLMDPDVSWVDPITNVYQDTTYHLYPTPARGANTLGSYMLYLPQDYYTSSKHKRYPVLYYLHGGNGNQRDGSWLIKKMDEAMKAGTMPETIIVSVQALPIGWYCNANQEAPGVQSGPVEDVLIHDLIPHIDATYRTIARPEARGVEGWSMGGFGAMRLAFKYPSLFGFASSLAGAVINWEDEHNIPYLVNTFGPNDTAHVAASKAYFDSVHPRVFAAQNAEAIKGHVGIRLLVGDQDWLYDNQGNFITKNFSDQLTALGIDHEYTVIPGVGHMLPDEIDAGTIKYPIEFWQKAFQQMK
jgi:S-formylglutathione hydrolase FrmB